MLSVMSSTPNERIVPAGGTLAPAGNGLATEIVLARHAKRSRARFTGVSVRVQESVEFENQSEARSAPTQPSSFDQVVFDCAPWYRIEASCKRTPLPLLGTANQQNCR